MKKSSLVIGLPLIGVKEGVECGVVKGIVVDPKTKKIKSLILLSAKNEYDFRELNICDIMGIGKDYVITQSIENAKNIDFADAGMTLLAIKCIASSGDILGSIEDFEFEEKTGDIKLLQINTGQEIAGGTILSLSNNLMFVDVSEDTSSGAAASSLEKEQKEFMLGRTVNTDIKNADGDVIIEKGTVVTDDIIRVADEADVMIDLTLGLE
ncbi:MAG: hypothetical protein PHO15_07080 [Eubacteriales bacterium]|nr:hypothetical protein [Eubacteriales bacterium]